jgi:hypothetical protein
MDTTSHHAFAAVSRRTAAWIATFTFAIGACNAIAQEGPAPSAADREPAAMQLAEVERLFWLCDYVATTRGVDAAPVDLCGAATEALKIAKFGGDFMSLLEWWRGNKPEAHARLASAEAKPSAQQDNPARAYAAAL